MKTIEKDPAFLFVKTIKQEFPKAETYLVGGVVRDALVGRQLKDYDFVVRNVSLGKLQSVLKKLGGVNLVGKKFGVLKFVPRALKKKGVTMPAFDIALPRLEFSAHETGHYRDFKIESDHRLALEDDLARRDFTMNALALNLYSKELVDPWGGHADILKKTIRAVGEPHHRFTEDYSRILRAARFACQLGFSIHSHTRDAIISSSSGLNKTIRADVVGKSGELIRAVPYEVIGREFAKALTADCLRAFDLYDELGLWKEVIPELLTMKKCPQPKTWHSEGDVWAHTRLALSVLSSKEFKKEFGEEKPDALLVLATLLHDIGKPTCLKMPKKDKVDRIRFDGHDRVGAGIARMICERLRTSSVEGHHVDPEMVHWLIKNHLLLLNSDLSAMKNTTIERHFYSDPYRGTTLQKLNFVDGSASITASGKKGLERYRAFQKRLVRFKKTSGTKTTLPRSILNGDDIMTVCKLQSGPRVGELLALLREEQLAGRIKTKTDAKTFVKKMATKL